MKRFGSKIKISVAALTVLICFLGIASWVELGSFHEHHNSLREPASHDKLRVLKGDHKHHSHFSKAKSYFSVSIHTAQPRPLLSGDPAVLEAEIVSRFDLDNVEFSWSLPKSVGVVFGNVTGTIGPMTANQAIRIPLTVTPSHNGNHQIHFHVVTRSKSGELKGQVAQFNTVDIESMRQDEQVAAFESVFGDSDQERVKFQFVQ